MIAVGLKNKDGHVAMKKERKRTDCIIATPGEKLGMKCLISSQLVKGMRKKLIKQNGYGSGEYRRIQLRMESGTNVRSGTVSGLLKLHSN